jgi:hypothetical protein
MDEYGTTAAKKKKKLADMPHNNSSHGLLWN